MKIYLMLALFLLIPPLVIAQENFDANSGFQWLIDHCSDGNCLNSIKTTAYYTLALKESGAVEYAQQGLDYIKSRKDSNDCWPAGNCNMEETAFAMLVEAAERALAHTGKKELVLGGGVACNARLQEMCHVMCRERKAKFFCPPHEFLVDNGAMIAYTGELMFNAGVKEKAEKVDIRPRERTDDVAVLWR